MTTQNNSVFKAILLVAGTSIGGGMLALPVLTSLGGFIPSMFIYILCWLFMMSTGLLMMEVGLWMKGESNLVSMAERTLGLPGKIAAWCLYLFLFYCLTVAYLVGCGQLFSEFTGERITVCQGTLLFVAIFAPFVYAGAKTVGHINAFLMVGLAFFYCAFVFIGYKYVNSELLVYQDWKLSLRGLPIAFTAFAYQGTIPTLMTYLNHDTQKTRKAIIIGSSLPLLAYIVWQWLILGIVPTFGPGGLAEALEQGQTAVYPLREFLQNPNVYFIGQAFAFFALVTSFLGVSIGLVDFLADGLNLEKTHKGKAIIFLIIFAPTLLIACLYPHIFLEALNFAGGFGTALLLGLVPILMVWVGRYRLHLSADYSFPGGRFVLSLLILFVIIEVSAEIAHLAGYL